MSNRAPKSIWDVSWRPDPGSMATMAALAPGTNLTIVKRGPNGAEVTRYSAAVVETTAPRPWLEVVAAWTLHRVEVAGLAFETGDSIHEFFSAEHPFNAFAVFSPEGALRGWYGNVTYPAFIDEVDGTRVLVWHDLYLDVVILLDGTRRLIDDDELEASGIPNSHPEFAAAIIRARKDLIAIIPTLIPRHLEPLDR